MPCGVGLVNRKGGNVNSGTTIVSLTARQVYSDRGHPGIEATVMTENGATGVALGWRSSCRGARPRATCRRLLAVF